MYQLYAIREFGRIVYIGQTLQSKGYKTRFKEHLKCYQKDNCLLHKVINDRDFTVSLLIHNIPKSKIDYYEILWIKKFNTHYINGKGYNMTVGGEGVIGHKHTKETLIKISMSAKKHWENLKINDPEKYTQWCKHLGEINRGRIFSEEHKKKISLAAKTRIGDKNPFWNKTHTEEFKRYVSKLNSKPVYMIDKDTGEIIKKFESLVEASKWLFDNNITSNKNCSSRISKICLGKGKIAYGYKWSYKQDVTTIP